jgi:putative iron-regulated protein
VFLSGTLNAAGDILAIVATGYHAVVFVLWGLYLTVPAGGAGERQFPVFEGRICTKGNCERRAEYLKAASRLLVSDLEEMVDNWDEDGAARTVLLQGEAPNGIATILTGMGSHSYGELAGERMKLGLLLHDPEEEHDCFSDNTTNSHYYDALGIQNVYLGRYVRVDGSEVTGASVSELVAAKAPEVDTQLQADLQSTVDKMQAMRERAEGGEAYDQMIGEGNAEGNAAVQAAIDALVTQTKTIEQAVGALDLDQIAFEGSDSLDTPTAVFQ